ncbi:MAG: hypothetical protein R3Y64_08500 [Peptostreptococcaceae bacterium]
MNLEQFINMENEKIPKEIINNLESIGNITKLKYEDKNNILGDKNQYFECGYEKMDGDYYLVSMYTPMPNVTKEMVDWWFWWHPQDSKRYKAWYPGEHISINYNKKDKEYFSSKLVPQFKNNTQYPVEKVGNLLAPLSIDFVSPEEFGFNKELMDLYNVETIICGHVGAFKGLIQNTDMAHIFLKQEQGLLLVSRFWLGKNVKSKFLKKLLVTESQAKQMAQHCCVEYRNFNERIPKMYEEWLIGL